MKKYILFTLLATLLFAGCGKDKVDYTNNGSSSNGGNTNTQYGYLELPSTIYVDLSSENFEEVQTKADGDNQIEAGDNYIVTITNLDDNTQTYKDTYGNLKAEEELALRPAPYNITIVSTEDIPYMSQKAEYAASEDFAIVGGMTTVIEDLACTMSNIKISVSFSADILELFQEDVEDATQNLNIKVELGENEANYGRNEINQATFFRAVENSNVITLSLTGMYNTAPGDLEPVYEMIEDWHHTITGVKAGQWRKVGIRIENSSSGNVTFVIDVQTWVYDENIDVDIMSQSYVFEEEILGDDTEGETSDPDAPVVTLANGHDIAEPFVISSSIFDFDAETCSDVIKSYITPAAGSTIESVDLTIDSNNKSLIAAISEAGFTESTISLLPTNTCEEYISIKSENGAVVATVKYDGMSSLYNYVGEHTVNVAATDSEGRTSHTSITINVVGADGDVTIEWRDGYSFDERHEISATTTLPVVIDIASESGITDFIIKINSKVLTVELLDELNLATTMDLIHPATPEMEKTLSDLQFPVGEEAIEGATTLKFDITSFMPLLASLGSGETDFELWVSDATGTTIRKIMLTTVSE